MAMTSSRPRKKPLTERQINKRKRARKFHPRRVEIIQMIAAFGLLQRKEIEELLFADTGVRNNSAIWEHLKEMKEWGHVSYSRGGLLKGGYYSLTPRGRREFGLRAYEFKTGQKPTLMTANHRDAMVKSYVWLKEWSRRNTTPIAIATETEIEAARRSDYQQLSPRLSRIPNYYDINKKFLTYKDPQNPNRQATPDFLVWRLDGGWDGLPVPVEVELTIKQEKHRYQTLMRIWDRAEIDEKIHGVMYLWTSDRPKVGRELKKRFDKIKVRPTRVQVLEAKGVETMESELA